MTWFGQKKSPQELIYMLRACSYCEGTVANVFYRGTCLVRILTKFGSYITLQNGWQRALNDCVSLICTRSTSNVSILSALPL